MENSRHLIKWVVIFLFVLLSALSFAGAFIDSMVVYIFGLSASPEGVQYLMLIWIPVVVCFSISLYLAIKKQWTLAAAGVMLLPMVWLYYLWLSA
jgi:hypothetical protein